MDDAVGKMIELRWVTFTSGATKVLQYRYRSPLMTDDVKSFPPRDWSWSEWEDVPMVWDATK